MLKVSFDLNLSYFWIHLNTFEYMNDLTRRHKPTAIRLKELKAPLQREAMKQDRSLNYLIIKILKDFVTNNLKK